MALMSLCCKFVTHPIFLTTLHHISSLLQEARLPTQALQLIILLDSFESCSFRIGHPCLLNCATSECIRMIHCWSLHLLSLHLQLELMNQAAAVLEKKKAAALVKKNSLVH